MRLGRCQVVVAGAWTPALLAALVLTLTISPAAALASWLDELWSGLRNRAASTSTPASATSLDHAVAYMRTLPQPAAGSVFLAAHIGQEGHWTFANPRGETFTAGTPDEMKRVTTSLAPDAPEAGVELTLFLTRTSALLGPELLRALPPTAKLHVVIGTEAYPLLRQRIGSAEHMLLALSPRVRVSLFEPTALDETLEQLARPLTRERLRLIALEPGGLETLPRHAKADPSTGRSPIEAVDPTRLPAAFTALRGQTALISGRISGDLIAYRPRSGAELTIKLSELTRGAALAGVDLLIVQSVTPHQPGTRNWLWQRFEIDGLDKGLVAPTFGDLIANLLGARGPVVITSSRPADGRVMLRAGPADGVDQTNAGGLGGVVKEVTAGLTGNISPSMLDAYLIAAGERREFGRRLVPFVPSALQALYLGGLAAGLGGFTALRRWWRRLWPAENAGEYASRAGYLAAQGIRVAVFALLFVPVAGAPALLATLLRLVRRMPAHVSH